MVNSRQHQRRKRRYNKHMTSPKVSVILTSYNHAPYLRQAIDSVLAQSYSDLELIIVDDASIDDSWSIIKQYQDKRIIAQRNETRRMLSWSLNHAIQVMAHGEYIAIHHSDDVWMPEKLAKQIAYLDGHAETGAVFTLAHVIDEQGRPFRGTWTQGYNFIVDQQNRNRQSWLRHFLEQGNVLCHPSALVRTRCYSECGLYRNGLAQLSDLDMWIRVCRLYEIHIIEEILTHYRVLKRKRNMSGNRRDSRIRTVFDTFQIINQFATTTDANEIFLIYPEYKDRIGHTAAPSRYIVAMLLIEKNYSGLGALIGLNILFDLLQDENMAIHLQQSCNFNVHELIRLAGVHDIFAREIPTACDNVYQQIGSMVLEPLLRCCAKTIRSVDSLRHTPTNQG